MHRRFDPIAIVEAAYRVDVDEDTWMRGVGEALRDSSKYGLGSYAHRYHCPPGAPIEVLKWRNWGVPQGFLQNLQERYASYANDGVIDMPDVTEIHAAPGVVAEVASVASPSKHWGELGPPLVTPFGLNDIMGLRIAEPDGSGVFFGFGLPEEGPLSPAERQRWYRVAVHVAAGFRLRLALQREPADALLDGADAVLDPSGRLRHASGDEVVARAESLREAARRIDRARSKERGEPDAALELWKGLVEGEWSLVDTFDTDGRRFVVVRRNDPDFRDPRALTERERQVAFAAGLGHSNKRIAYALGLSTSTVGTHLSNAIRKLGARNRQELMHVLTSMSSGQDEAPSG